MTTANAATEVGGPYFDELTVGQVFDTAPAVTITDGLAAAHQAILGDRLRLPLDAHLSAAVAGGPVAHAGLVTDLAIGQSTLVTHHVKANLFYRGLRFHRFPHLGDTLYTTTEVVGLKENSVKPGRKPTGLAALRMNTVDQNGRTVLDFYRCAMLPLSENPDPERVVAADDLSAIGPQEPPRWSAPADWDLAAYRTRVPGTHFDPSLAGAVLRSSGDVVTSAPELARLTLNIAATHHDERVGAAGRLVYGGHTIGLALAQATRALPNLVTVLGWHSCDHTGPVHEGDTLTSDLHIDSAHPLDSGGGVLELRSIVHAHRGTDAPAAVLDWRFTALMA
ncbi:acyl dehydratase [Rhodococcus ruber Chol-4]|uniref:MaoC family dehydratase n=1 Tax=Rhodococcus TaxID=1827 RepID=UPI00034AAB07|nr:MULTISPECIES: MaoC family dehydratase [Rhodococcus]AWH00871.1 acyl dehydratase [Rhodococcus ruber]KXF86006.1 acyl dehydratase [Rhodococcus ruber Chol-4]MCZ1073019.1 MaoC family dehydratase [Rhodococcus sp. A5(2022)]